MNWDQWTSFCSKEIDDLLRNYQEKDIFNMSKQFEKKQAKQSLMSSH